MRQPLIAELFDRHADALVLFARTWCQMPEDAVQAAFIDLAQLAEFPDRPIAWLYTTTKRKALNLARSESRRCQHTRSMAEGAPRWFEAGDPETEMRDAELREALQMLTAEDREIIVARVWGQLGFEELSRVFDSSVATTFRRYQSALEKLKTILERNR